MLHHRSVSGISRRTGPLVLHIFRYNILSVQEKLTLIDVFCSRSGKLMQVLVRRFSVDAGIG